MNMRTNINASCSQCYPISYYNDMSTIEFLLFIYLVDIKSLKKHFTVH